MAEDNNKRTGSDRRQQLERRIDADHDHIYDGLEKRKKKDRRSGIERREKP